MLIFDIPKRKTSKQIGGKMPFLYEKKRNNNSQYSANDGSSLERAYFAFVHHIYFYLY